MSDVVNNELLLQRLAYLEDTVAALQSSATTLRAGGVPPKPLGITAVTQPGIIAVEWDAVQIGDLSHYDVDIATDSNFLDAERFTTTNPYYTYFGGLAGVAYYFRARAVNRDGEGGGWSATVTTSVGTVDSTLLGTDVSSNLDNAKRTSERFQAYFFTKTSGFSTLSSGGTTTATYGPLDLYVPDRIGATAMINVSIEGALDSQFPGAANVNYMTLDLRRATEDGAQSTIKTVQRDFSYARGGSGSSGDEEYISFPPYVEQPDPGKYEYYIRLTITSGGSNTITFTGSDIRLTGLVFS